MKRLTTIIFLLISTMIISTGCHSSKQLLDTKISYDNIDRIQVITAMGNPKYGAKSKTITDANEIKAFVNSFNDATIGKKVNDKDVNIAMPSYYYIYSKDILVAAFVFNGNDTNKVWYNENYYYIDYPESRKTPFELYNNSKADICIVDAKGNEIQRPQD